jgi:hypothetical protein
MYVRLLLEISLKKGIEEKSSQTYLCDYVLPSRFSMPQASGRIKVSAK